ALAGLLGRQLKAQAGLLHGTILPSHACARYQGLLGFVQSVPKRIKRSEGPLTQIEFDMFNARRKRIIFGFTGIFSLAIFLGVNDKLLQLKIPVGAIFVCGASIMLWTLIQMLKFKCPRCNTTPMTTRTSLGGGGVEIGGYVALRPKKCHKCGVLFEPPK
ncbi:MAG: hypothetical protein LCH73_10085, partial [Proteobacteria bacterium]|nr:hypothetical protein [Pseudomonadota bacterium]